MKNENVLCIPLASMRKIFSLDNESWVTDASTINSLDYEYVARAIAENDNSYKQLIPYAIVSDSQGRILHYRRCGSEKRLANILSAGIGGHVNDSDNGVTIYDKLIAGLIREFGEEVGVTISADNIKLVGMINEEHTPVGHCHTGVVFSISVDCANMHFDENELGDIEWKKVTELDFSQFEIWSSLAIRLTFS